MKKSSSKKVIIIIGVIIAVLAAAGITVGVLAANGVFDGEEELNCAEDEEKWCVPLPDRHDCSCRKIHNNDSKVDENGNIIVEHYTLKPIIYFYPEKEIDLKITVGFPEKLTTVYPEYEDGWEITAYPNGDLIDKASGTKLYALYWEGKEFTEKRQRDTGFVVKGEDTAAFLEEKLEILGLNYREREEFIVFWLPKLEKNDYNYIYFASAEEIEAEMPLELSVQPDTLIRVRMIYEKLDEPIEIEEQTLEPAPERTGFTVVEWGGVEY